MMHFVEVLQSLHLPLLSVPTRTTKSSELLENQEGEDGPAGESNRTPILITRKLFIRCNAKNARMDRGSDLITRKNIAPCGSGSERIRAQKDTITITILVLSALSDLVSVSCVGCGSDTGTRTRI